jgi:nucleoid DNA-binding protein
VTTINSTTDESVTRSELVQKISERLQISEIAARQVVDSVLESITSALVEGRKVNIYGFGSFTVKNLKARIGRNVRTGEKINVAPRRKVAFKPSRPLTEQVNE